MNRGGGGGGSGGSGGGGGGGGSGSGGGGGSVGGGGHIGGDFSGPNILKWDEGPRFDVRMPANLTVAAGQTAVLRCRVYSLANKTVRCMDQIIIKTPNPLNVVFSSWCLIEFYRLEIQLIILVFLTPLVNKRSSNLLTS